MQKITSKNTSINQVPKLHKFVVEGLLGGRFIDGGKEGNRISILDYGCGKYNKGKDYIEANLDGCIVHCYDPFNRSEAENSKSIGKDDIDLILCSNVLNVIQEIDVVRKILYNLSKYEVKCLFSVYCGDSSGIGKVTTKGYQRNERAVVYEEMLKVYFSSILRIGNIFVCE